MILIVCFGGNEMKVYREIVGGEIEEQEAYVRWRFVE